MTKKLYRSKENQKLLGVCGGLGEFFDIDPTMVRLAWVFMVLAGGAGILLYVAAALIVPEKPYEQNE